MPDIGFRRTLRQWGNPEIAHILNLAKQYDVSKEAAARKYVALHDEPCAIVFSHNGGILYGQRGEDFPYLEIGKGRPLPTGSLTRRDGLADGIISACEEVDPHIWLSYTRGVKSLTEQALGQRDGYRMTMLCAEIEDSDELEDENGPHERDAPRFQR